MTDYCKCHHMTTEWFKDEWFCASCFALVRPEERPFGPSKKEGGGP